MPLNDEEIEQIAQEISHTGSASVDPGTVNDEEMSRIKRRVEEIEAAQPVPEPPAAPVVVPTEEPDLLPGGITTPSGWQLVGTITAANEDGDDRFYFTDLLPTVRIEKIRTVSATLNRTGYSSPTGHISGRIIADQGGCAYIFRQDEDETTHFMLVFSHQGIPIV